VRENQSEDQLHFHVNTRTCNILPLLSGKYEIRRKFNSIIFIISGWNIFKPNRTYDLYDYMWIHVEVIRSDYRLSPRQWLLKNHCCYQSSLWDTILSSLHPLPILTTYVLDVLLNVILSSASRSFNCLFSRVLTTNILYIFLSSHKSQITKASIFPDFTIRINLYRPQTPCHIVNSPS
jgi:hypothetical protein